VSDGSAIICQDRLRTGFTEARKLLWICKREERCCVAFPACWICAYIGDVELPPLARLRCGQTDATFSDAIYALETIDLPDRETSKKEGRFLCRRLHKSNISTSPLQLVTLADIPPSTAGAVLAVKTDADAEAYLLRGNNVH
jgi:hypothetical protein